MPAVRKLVVLFAVFLIIGAASVTVSAYTNLPRIPEPSSILLLGSGLVGLGYFARKKLKSRN